MQFARARDHGIDVDVLVPALRLIGRQPGEHLGAAAPQVPAFLCAEPVGDRDDVVPAITVRGKRELLPAALEVAQPGARSEDFHLPAVVIDVVLALDVVAGRLEQVAERRAVGGVAAVPDMQRTGRIRRHEFQQHAPSGTVRRASVGGTGCQEAADLLGVGGLGQEKVDEAGARHLDLGDCRVGGQGRPQGFGKLARILARRLGEPHRQIAGEVAVRRVARVFDLERQLPRGGGHEVFGQGLQRPAQ